MLLIQKTILIFPKLGIRWGIEIKSKKIGAEEKRRKVFESNGRDIFLMASAAAHRMYEKALKNAEEQWEKNKDEKLNISTDCG